jgi:hypothetical protein
VGPKCTCGALLPPDARFCHKCGKPQYDDPLLAGDDSEQPESVPDSLPATYPAAQPAASEPPSINFHNRIAVRIGFLTAMATSMTLMIPFPVLMRPLLFLLAPLAGGFVSVYWYRRRTGLPSSLRSGAQMGWITGVFCFMIATVLFTAVILILSQMDLAAALAEQSAEQRQQLETALEVVRKARQNPPDFLIPALVLLFGFFGFIPTVGGALGGKMFEKH